MGMSDPPRTGIDIEHDDGIAILSVSRDLDLSCTARAHAAVEELVASGVRQVCVDLDGAQFVDSSGVAVLLRVLEDVAGPDGTMVVATAAPGILRVLSLLGVEEQLTVVADRESALRAIRA